MMPLPIHRVTTICFYQRKAGWRIFFILMIEGLLVGATPNPHQGMQSLHLEKAKAI
jgi:hypothetical protein